MESRREIVNPLFRVVQPRRAKRSGRAGRRPGPPDLSSSESDDGPSGFGPNVQTLEKDKAYLLSKFGALREGNLP